MKLYEFFKTLKNYKEINELTIDGKMCSYNYNNSGKIRNIPRGYYLPDCNIVSLDIYSMSDEDDFVTQYVDIITDKPELKVIEYLQTILDDKRWIKTEFEKPKTSLLGSQFPNAKGVAMQYHNYTIKEVEETKEGIYIII